MEASDGICASLRIPVHQRYHCTAACAGISVTETGIEGMNFGVWECDSEESEWWIYRYYCSLMRSG